MAANEKESHMSDVLGVGKAVEKLVDPIVDLVKKIAGPAAEEVGLSLQDSVKVWRARRQFRLFEKMKDLITAAGYEPKRVTLKLLLPAIDYASVEEDEDLHTAWAALLANAADPRRPVDVLPSFPDILRQLSKTEAMFLNAIFDVVNNRLRRDNRTSVELARLALTVDLGEWTETILIFAGTGLTKNQGRDLITHSSITGRDEDFLAFMVASDSLMRANLLLRVPVVKMPSDLTQESVRMGRRLPSRDHYSMTALGYEFVRACRAPEPNKT
jgi:hypothetical protein